MPIIDSCMTGGILMPIIDSCMTGGILMPIIASCMTGDILMPIIDSPSFYFSIPGFLSLPVVRDTYTNYS